MKVPDAEAAMYRRQSLTSNGSTASLTSVLDHDSYTSEPEYGVEQEDCCSADQSCPGDGVDAQSKTGVHFNDQPKQLR